MPPQGNVSSSLLFACRTMSAVVVNQETYNWKAPPMSPRHPHWTLMDQDREVRLTNDSVYRLTPASGILASRVRFYHRCSERWFRGNALGL